MCLKAFIVLIIGGGILLFVIGALLFLPTHFFVLNKSMKENKKIVSNSKVGWEVRVNNYGVVAMVLGILVIALGFVYQTLVIPFCP